MFKSRWLVGLDHLVATKTWLLPSPAYLPYRLDERSKVRLYQRRIVCTAPSALFHRQQEPSGLNA